MRAGDEVDQVLALTVATTLLVLIPGPNVALIVANSLKCGRRSGLVTVFGTTAGVALQLALVVAGMALVIELAASALTWIRWLGVLYLIGLGIRTWREAVPDQRGVPEPSPVRTYLHGLTLAVVNPKTLIFNAAFLPQFVTDASAAGGQLPLLALVFLTVVALGDSCWVLFASSAGRWLARLGKWRNRLTGAVLAGAGVSLALSQR